MATFAASRQEASLLIRIGIGGLRQLIHQADGPEQPGVDDDAGRRLTLLGIGDDMTADTDLCCDLLDRQVSAQPRRAQIGAEDLNPSSPIGPTRSYLIK